MYMALLRLSIASVLAFITDGFESCKQTQLLNTMIFAEKLQCEMFRNFLSLFQIYRTKIYVFVSDL